MTLQTPDNIIIKGDKYYIRTFPLDDYWTKKKPKPETRLIKTSCWRGYSATWEISDNCLYLVDILYNTPEGDAGINYVFPKRRGKIKAKWFTGELKVPIGDMLYMDRDEGPVRELNLFLSIEKGDVISHRYKANG